MKMKCLSLWQPWAWAMLASDGPHKNIENRTWLIKHRVDGVVRVFSGPLLIHASAGCGTRVNYAHAYSYIRGMGFQGPIPSPETVQRGGIVGAFEVHGYTKPEDWKDTLEGGNGWHMYGQFGYHARNPVQLPFRPYKGKQGLFDVELTRDEEQTLRAAGLLRSE